MSHFMLFSILSENVYEILLLYDFFIHNISVFSIFSLFLLVETILKMICNFFIDERSLHFGRSYYPQRFPLRSLSNHSIKSSPAQASQLFL